MAAELEAPALSFLLALLSAFTFAGYCWEDPAGSEIQGCARGDSDFKGLWSSWGKGINTGLQPRKQARFDLRKWRLQAEERILCPFFVPSCRTSQPGGAEIAVRDSRRPFFSSWSYFSPDQIRLCSPQSVYNKHNQPRKTCRQKYIVKKTRDKKSVGRNESEPHLNMISYTNFIILIF